ncbi:hypothetical protein G6F57_019435 [Rhizopus arrhizus]|nr:hypothetical protein G6F57_019435 [Rhizopus arrhizus]
MRRDRPKPAIERKTATLRQALDASRQVRVGQRGELVEQRRDEHRIDDQERQVEHGPKRPRPDPPVGARAAHQPQHRSGPRQAQHGGHQQALGGIGNEEFRCHAVEPEARLKLELPP